MTLQIDISDKILSGVNHSYTLTSDEGPPSGEVLLEGAALSHRVIALGPPKTATETTTPETKYKVSFHIPEESAGKTLVLRFKAGSSTVEESKAVTDS